MTSETPQQPTLPKLHVSDAAILEGDSGASYLLFEVTLDSFANGYVNVDFATSDATATAAAGDYIAADGSLTIAPGFTSGEIRVTVNGDRLGEYDETLTLTLSDASANAVLERAAATGTILSDELPGEGQTSLPEVPRGVISHGIKGRPIEQAILDHPDVTGFLLLGAWKDIEPEEGQFDWTHLDAELARAEAAGKLVRLALHIGGDSTPEWAFRNYPNLKRIIWYDKVTGETRWVPAFWDPLYIELKRRFFDALGERYKHSDTIFATSASMANPNTNDWAFVIKDPAQLQSYLDAGFSEQAFVRGFKAIIDAAMAAFENKYVVTAVGPVPRVLVGDRFAPVHEVLDYAYTAYGDRLILAKGALHAATPEPEDSSGTAWETMTRYAPNIAGQFVWAVTRDPDYKMNGKVPYGSDEIPAVFRRTVEKAKRYGMRWIEPWRIDIMNPDLQHEIAYAAQLLSSD